MPMAPLIAVPALAALSFLGVAMGHRMQAAPQTAPSLLEVAEGLPKRALVAPLLAASATSALAPPQKAKRPSRLWSTRLGDDGWDAAGLGAVAAPQRSFPRPLGFPEEGELRLEEIPARILGYDDYRGDPWRDIVLPADWAWELQPGSAEFILGEDGANPRMMGVARTAWNLDVKFGVWQSGDGATSRHLHLSEMLRDSQVVPKILDIRAYPEETFVLSESPGTRTLSSEVFDWQQRGVPAGEPEMPLSEALPLMIDMLEGLTVMDSYGIVHGDLTMENIYVVDGAQQLTLFDDFRSACVENSADAEISCRGLADTMCGSAFWHAPEVVSGVPDRVSSNVWQLGLVFANMLLGGVLSPWQEMGFDDVTAQGRQKIREVIRKEFSIWDDPVFTKLYGEYGDVLNIVAGMLEKDPRRRLTSEAALQQAVQVAAQRGIPLPWEQPVSQWSDGYVYSDGI